MTDNMDTAEGDPRHQIKVQLDKKNCMVLLRAGGNKTIAMDIPSAMLLAHQITAMGLEIILNGPSDETPPPGPSLIVPPGGG